MRLMTVWDDIILTHILLISVKSALFLMESFITWRINNGKERGNILNIEYQNSYNKRETKFSCLRTFGCPSRSSLWKTWQNFQQSTALLERGSRLTAAQKVWAPFSWWVPKMQGESGSQGLQAYSVCVVRPWRSLSIYQSQYRKLLTFVASPLCV